MHARWALQALYCSMTLPGSSRWQLPTAGAPAATAAVSSLVRPSPSFSQPSASQGARPSPPSFVQLSGDSTTVWQRMPPGRGDIEGILLMGRAGLRAAILAV